MTTVGIIGNGFVGNAINQAMKRRLFETSIFDIESNKSPNSLEEAVASDIIFVCVPAPTDIENGITDATQIMNIVKNIPKNHHSQIILKSTLLPGTSRKISEKRPDLNIVFSPEFLTERTAVIDFENPTRIVLGFSADKLSQENTEELNFFKKCFPDTYLICTDWETAEFIKYFCNCFYAAKVSLFNEFYQVANQMDIDWSTCLEGLLSSHWVNKMHTQVPGPDGDFGFGGKCFPKDILAFITFCENSGIKPLMLSSAWEKNVEVRTNKNWERISGAFTKGKKDVE